MLSPEQIKDLKERLNAAYCKHVLAHPQNRSTNEALDVRHYLSFKIILENANRSGVLCEMTLEDIKENEKYESKRVVHVAEHKTTKSYGSK